MTPSTRIAITLMLPLLLILLTGCEILEESTGDTGLPTVQLLLEEARKYDQSPYVVLERKFELKLSALETSYDNKATRLERRADRGTVGPSLYEAELDLLTLEEERAVLRLRQIYEQRKEELDKEVERLNRASQEAEENAGGDLQEN